LDGVGHAREPDEEELEVENDHLLLRVTAHALAVDARELSGLDDGV
jgi:hypothetical protein